MSLPIIGIAGEAGVGKDCVAGFIQKYTQNTICLAQADQMKAFAGSVFGFTEEQLYGPSECRNAGDLRFDRMVSAWDLARKTLVDEGVAWIDYVLPHLSTQARGRAMAMLVNWFDKLYNDHFHPEEMWKQLTPRTVLQTLGTEYGRAIDPKMWSRLALHTAHELLNGGIAYSRTNGLNPDPSCGIPDFVLLTDVRFPNEIINLAAEGARILLVKNPNPGEAQAAVQAGGVSDHSSEAYLKQIPRHWYSDILVNDKGRGLGYLEDQVANYVYALKRADTYV